MRSRARFIFGWVLGWLVTLWLGTLRVRLVGSVPNAPCILCFWHAEQFVLYGWARRRFGPRPVAALVSASTDGDLLAAGFSPLGVEVVRGSSSRRGAGALRAMLRAAERGRDIAFAVDGPKGPPRVPKGGAVLAGRRSGHRLLPIGVASSRSWRLSSWDRFELPWPFARVVVVVGEPLEPGALSSKRLARAVDDASARAATSLGAQRGRELLCAS